MDLKSKVENQVKDIVIEINDLTLNQQINHDKLDNYNRRKQELEDRVKQIMLMKEDLEERFKKLHNLNIESKATITEMTIKRQELNEEMDKTKTILSNLENDMIKVSKELCESKIDNYMISHQIRKAEIIKMLKQSFSGVVLFLSILLVKNLNNHYYKYAFYAFHFLA